MKDIRQTKEYAKYMSAIGWDVEKIDGVYCYIRRIPLIGSFIKIQRIENLNLNKLSQLAKSAYTFQIVVEPANETLSTKLLEQKFSISKSPYVPSKTLELNLRKSEPSILKNTKKDCRYALRKTEKVNLRIMNDAIPEFQKAWKNAVIWNRPFTTPPHFNDLVKSFGKNCLLLASEKLDSGAVFLKTKSRAYYWQAFTNKGGRKSLVQYKIVWEGIHWAKKNGAKVFDFEGIYDERFPDKKWLGFTHFKKSFGGVEIAYPGALSKTIFKFPFKK